MMGRFICLNSQICADAEGNIVLICKKLVQAPLLPETFLDDVNDGKFYPKKDYHTLYIAEIEKILIKI